MEEITIEKNRPPENLPYQHIDKPFRTQEIIPGPGIEILRDKNGVCRISTKGGSSVSDFSPGYNIEIYRDEDGNIIISEVNSVAHLADGDNAVVTIDDATGVAVITKDINYDRDEHFKGVFSTPKDLIAIVNAPVEGDYGLVRSVTISNGISSVQCSYKFCYYLDGSWVLADQMLAFSDNPAIRKNFLSLGGLSRVVYLHEVARSGNFWDLDPDTLPVVKTPRLSIVDNTISASCDTAGAEIRYTVDGSMPNASSILYSSPITVEIATSFRFVAVKNGMINSFEATASVGFALLSPDIDLDFRNGIVNIFNPNSDNDPTSSIYYTTDGSDPTSLSAKYKNPFVVNDACTIKAVVIDSMDVASPVAKLYCPKLPDLYYNLLIQYAVGFQTLDIKVKPDDNLVANPVIRYGFNRVPSYNDSIYDSGITFPIYDGPTLLSARAYLDGYIPSDIISFDNLWQDNPEKPSISYDENSREVTIVRSGFTEKIPLIFDPLVDDKMGCRIYYTTDGSVPSIKSNLYTGPFLSDGGVIKAILVAYGRASSAIAELSIDVLSAPVFSLDSKTGFLSIEVADDTVIYYTLDESNPDKNSLVYYSPIPLLNFVNNSAVVVKAVSHKNGFFSPTTSATYRVPHAPEFDKKINYDTGVVTVTLQKYPLDISFETKYTLSNGETPPEPTYDSQTFNGDISANYFDAPVLCARIYAAGYLPSEVRTVICGESVVPPPVIVYDEEGQYYTFQRNGVAENIPLQTNKNIEDYGCRIYYTTNGESPLEEGVLWDGNPVYLDRQSVVKAVLVCYGIYNSVVVSSSDVWLDSYVWINENLWMN